jgi:hypothetical protein
MQGVVGIALGDEALVDYEPTPPHSMPKAAATPYETSALPATMRARRYRRVRRAGSIRPTISSWTSKTAKTESIRRGGSSYANVGRSVGPILKLWHKHQR